MMVQFRVSCFVCCVFVLTLGFFYPLSLFHFHFKVSVCCIFLKSKIPSPLMNLTIVVHNIRLSSALVPSLQTRNWSASWLDYPVDTTLLLFPAMLHVKWLAPGTPLSYSGFLTRVSIYICTLVACTYYHLQLSIIMPFRIAIMCVVYLFTKSSAFLVT